MSHLLALGVHALSTDIVPGIEGNPDKVERSRELVGLQLEDEDNLAQKRPVLLNRKREPVLSVRRTRPQFRRDKIAQFQRCCVPRAEAEEGNR